MAYEKTNWESGVTPCSASNFNKMEEGIYNNSVFLEQLSNSNVLHNADFRYPVNQRGLISYQGSSSKYVFTLDRWFLSKTSVNYLGIGDGCCTVTIASGGFFAQGIEDVNMLSDVMTVSIKLINEENVYILTKQSGDNFGTVTKNGKSVDVVLDGYFFKLVNNSTSLVTLGIEYIKLENGNKATPFVPRPFAYELLLCKRYYESNEVVFSPMAGITPASYYIVANGMNFEVEKYREPDMTFSSLITNYGATISSSITSHFASKKYLRNIGLSASCSDWYLRTTYIADAEIYP